MFEIIRSFGRFVVLFNSRDRKVFAIRNLRTGFYYPVVFSKSLFFVREVGIVFATDRGRFSRKTTGPILRSKFVYDVHKIRRKPRRTASIFVSNYRRQTEPVVENLRYAPKSRPFYLTHTHTHTLRERVTIAARRATPTKQNIFSYIFALLLFRTTLCTRNVIGRFTTLSETSIRVVFNNDRRVSFFYMHIVTPGP